MILLFCGDFYGNDALIYQLMNNRNIGLNKVRQRCGTEIREFIRPCLSLE
jgi:hypothetical protein